MLAIFFRLGVLGVVALYFIVSGGYAVKTHNWAGVVTALAGLYFAVAAYALLPRVD